MPDQLLLLLNFIYTDEWVEDSEFALDMIPIADRFSVLDLKRLCERTLICTMSVDNVARIFALADRYACARLLWRVRFNEPRLVHVFFSLVFVGSGVFCTEGHAHTLTTKNHASSQRRGVPFHTITVLPCLCARLLQHGPTGKPKHVQWLSSLQLILLDHPTRIKICCAGQEVLNQIGVLLATALPLPGWTRWNA